MPQPPCDGCERLAFEVTPSLAIAAKAKAGKANASTVTEVGDGGLVADELLGGAPIESSEWGGHWRTIEVVAAYPVSQWNPTESRWERARTGTKTWTRSHSGDSVIPLTSARTYSDTYAEAGLVLDEDEAIVPGYDEDPADFGEGNLSLLESSVDTSGYVGRIVLLNYVATMPSTWSTYAEAILAAPGFGDYTGPAAGILLTGGYDTETDHPHQVQRMITRWGMNLVGPDIPAGVPGVGSPFIAAPGLTLRAAAHRWTRDEAADPVTETDLPDVTLDCPYLSAVSGTLWASYTNGTNPETAGWQQLGGLFDAAGLITQVEAYQWGLDLGPKW